MCEDNEDNVLEMKCPEHTVVLIFTIAFGRFNSDVCPDKDMEGYVPVKTCYSVMSWPVAFQKCVGKQECRVQASSDEFGDPCPGRRKYLSVSYTCRSSKNK